ncbi:MAG TPA: hypothetical protein VL425_10980, partial [Rudaea sp.]|nr:hypothetical protein [Rudaea sp.]
AWAAMAHAGDWLASAFLSGVQGQPIYAQVRKAADTALRLDPNLAAAHNVRGEQLGIIDFDWKGSEAEQRRALELEPGNNQTMENLGVGRAQAGRSEEAIAMTRQSLVTDPMRASGYLLLARYLTAADRLDEAERAIRRAIELQPAAAHFDAGLVDIEVRRDDAKAALDAAQKVPPGNWQDYALAMASQIGNDRAAADAALQRLIAKDADGMYFQIAEVQAVRGDANQTFAWLDRALANRDSGLQFLLVNPFILRFKDDPRFAAFCKRLGVPATTDAKAMP